MRRRVRGSTEAESGCSTKSCGGGETGGKSHYVQSTGEFSTKEHFFPSPNKCQYLISNDVPKIIYRKKGSILPNLYHT